MEVEVVEVEEVMEVEDVDDKEQVFYICDTNKACQWFRKRTVWRTFFNMSPSSLELNSDGFSFFKLQFRSSKSGGIT